MKRILSFSLLALMATSAYSQSLWSEPFDTYTTGNLGSQGGWARDGGGSAAWTKIAAIDAGHGKSFQLGSTATNTDGVWEYHDTNWSTKSADNNIFVLEFDYYTGAGGAGGAGVTQIYDVGSGYALAMEIGWSQDDGYLYLADESDGIILKDVVATNTWYHIKASYDSTTGEIKAKVDNDDIMIYAGTPELYPDEYDVLLAAVSTSGFDNITVKAVAIDPFLAVSDVNAAKSKLSVYPNPATDVINVKSDSKIAQVSIYDLSGKAVKTSTETTINVENLAKGSYVVSIKYADGTTESKKVIKK